MATHEIVLGGATFTVAKLALVQNCPKFLRNPGLLMTPYRVVSAVSEEALVLFLATLEGQKPEFTAGYVTELFMLCEEFGFSSLLSDISDLMTRQEVVDDEARKRIWSIGERTVQQERTLCLLGQEIAEIREAHLREIATLRSQFSGENHSLREELRLQ
jgi:hypothetical protein